MRQQKKEIFIFLGPPGAGKGSLSKLCSQEFEIEYLSTGNLCRKHVENKTELGRKIDFLMKSGKLINDTFVSEMVCDWLQKKNNTVYDVIIDGFPRTKNQAQLFCNYLREKFFDIKLRILKLSVKPASVILRLCNRLVCSNNNCQKVYSLISNSFCVPKVENKCDLCSSSLTRRVDDCEDTIKNRLKIYANEEQELLSFFECNGVAVEFVDADRPIQEVFIDVKKKLFE